MGKRSDTVRTYIWLYGEIKITGTQEHIAPATSKGNGGAWFGSWIVEECGGVDGNIYQNIYFGSPFMFISIN